MSYKITLGIAAALVVISIGFFLTHGTTPATPAQKDAGAQPTNSPTQPAPQKFDQPTITAGPTTQKTIIAVAAFDKNSFLSTSTNPVVTGTANVPKVGIAVYNSDGRGLVGTNDIDVVRGHWSYTCSVALTPGTYTLKLVGGATDVSSTLAVERP